MAVANYKFTTLGKSKFVHVLTTKTNDLKQGGKGGPGANCQTVRRYVVADKVNYRKGKFLSVEAARALDPCPNCGTAAVLAGLVTDEERKARAQEERDATLAKMQPKRAKSKKGKGKAEPKPKAEGKAKRVKSKVGETSGGSTQEKADALAAFAREHGWKASTDDANPGVVVTAVRDDEVITCFFIDGKYDTARHASVEVGDWSGKLRGVHGCRKQIANSGRERPHPNPGQGRKVSKRSKVKADDSAEPEESAEDATRNLPFLQDDDDPTILRAILGKRIRWRSSIGGAIEEAWLPSEAKGKKRAKVEIKAHPKTGKRMVSFLAVLSVTEEGEQYGPERTVYLDRITRVLD